MGTLGGILLVVCVLLVNLPALEQQWRDDRAGAIKTLRLSGIYVFYVLIGIGIGLWLGMAHTPSGAPPNAWPALILILTWIFYGCITLMRYVPRYREPPRWLMHFGALDVVCIVLIAVSFAGGVAQLYMFS